MNCNYHLWEKYAGPGIQECKNPPEPYQLFYKAFDPRCGGATRLCTTHKEVIAKALELDGYIVTRQNEVVCPYCEGEGKIWDLEEHEV